MSEDQPRITNPTLTDADREDFPEDFAELFEASQTQREKGVQRDAKVHGTVVSVGKEWVFVDIGGKSEGAISVEELTDESGALTVNVGDPITAYVVSTRGDEIRLSVKMTAAASDEAIRGAYRSGVPVEGLVLSERKGGFTVRVLGKEAFCPYSQIDIAASSDREGYLNKKFVFRIAEYSEGGRNIVLSRRAILEEERARRVAQLKNTLASGDLVQGEVRNLAKFGAFVDIGGVEGLIPMSELAWHRVEDAGDVVRQGDKITVKVMDLDWVNNRISLSLKQTLEDPWSTAAARYPEGVLVEGTVTKLMNFGAFVALEPGIEGLVHVSNMGGGRRVNHPREVVESGERVEVTVLSVDQATRRMGLELSILGAEEAGPAVELREGEVVVGAVDSVKDYGVFVSLPGGKSGLLHVSEIEGGSKTDLKRRFPSGSPVDVEILKIDQESGKISLSTKSISRKTEQAQFKHFGVGQARGGASFGTLGDLLKDKLNR
jgi:small subunit ribosomal protein S1